MPRDLTLTRATKRSVTAILRDDGATVARLTCNPDNPISRAAVCRAARCDDAALLGWFDLLDRSPDDPRRVVVTLASAGDVAAGALTVRAFDGTVHSTHRTIDLVTVLPGVGVDALLCWEGDDAVCCLDIDYHGTPAPSATAVDAWVARLAPTPVAWHLSRGGGVHAFYVAQPPFTAKHLAAAAGLCWLTIDPTAGVEIKRQVRGPGDAKVHFAPAGQDTAGTLSAWLGTDTPDADATADWLAEHDMEVGRRYTHDKCPIDPTPDDGSRDPVVVGEAGVYCHRCSGKGRSLGSRSPGFAPWAALCKSPSAGEIGRLVKGMAHWGHAKWVLTQRYQMPEPLAKPAYEAALLAAHDGDPRVSLAFHPDTEDMARVNDSWVAIESNYVYKSTAIVPLLEVTPAGAYVSDDGKLKSRPSSVALLGQGGDLSSRGYGNIRVIHGFSFARPFLPTPAETVVPMPYVSLRKAGNQWCPTYVPRSKRMALDTAWHHVEQVFPTIHRNLVRTILCAAGSSQETKLGLQPLLFIAGCSGAAKTMTTKVAAAIMGSDCPAVTYHQDEGKLKAAVKEAATSAAVVGADEFLKESKRAMQKGWTPKSAMEPLLTLTPDTMCHVMYVGARRLGTVPALVMTETLCPPQVKQYTQIARRVRFVQLHGSRRDWKEKMAAAGLTGATVPRLRMVSSAMNAACDAILSDVVDEFFCLPTTWDAQADRLGVPTIEDSPEFENPLPQLLRLYQLICTAPPQPDRHGTRHKAEAGWRRVSRHEAATPDAQELLDLVDNFSDAMGPTWGQSVILQEKSWGDILGTDHPVQIDIHSEGGSVCYIRFRVGQPNKLLAVNGAIKDPQQVVLT